MNARKVLSTDVLVIGSGGTALRAILEAQDGGADVMVVVKNNFRKSGATFHSVAEVGAFNVPDGAGDPLDTPDVYKADILKAAQGMADTRLVDILVTEAEHTLRYLEGYGVHFEREGDRYLTFRACFSSKPRSHVIKDHFKPIVKSLGQEASRRGVAVHDRLMVVGLLTRDGECFGAHALDENGETVVIRAKATVLTTGGASQLFAKNLYPLDITGDGYAMAWRAGAQLANMEFMQAGVSIIQPFINLFGNYLWDARPNLVDREGVPFMKDYIPGALTVDQVMQEKERHFPFSSADISRYVEISIQSAINDGRGTAEGGVFMDFRHCDFSAILADRSRSIARMWPLTYDWYKEKGTDLYRDAVQITCSAHAINGGLRIDGNAETSLKGLFAAGETAAGPHGADRLGGNMAVTCQVFGARAGHAAAKRAKEVALPDVDDLVGEQEDFLSRFVRRGPDTPLGIRAEVQRSANRHLLILRSADGLTQFLSDLESLQARLQEATRAEHPVDFVHLIETANLIEVGRIMARAALARTESRGSHYREDAPHSDPAQAMSQIIDRNHPDGMFRAHLDQL